MSPYTIAIDGPSGTGKSSTAKEIARLLGIDYLDTGAMYRSLSLLGLEAGVKPGDEDALARLADGMELLFPSLGVVVLDGRDVSRDIRSAEVSARVSTDCAVASVRTALVARQRAYAQGRSCILDGRDVGTVVFPDARFKFYVDCAPEVRAHRRVEELKAMGHAADFSEVLANLVERDRLDSTRAVGPLRKADDAVVVDTSSVTFQEQVQIILDHVRKGLPSI
ncbi:MAG: (d)CMP kinase [Fibrobacteria bacterium]|nr:(d)CMP kinase [Fibrobacteria bacterium]